MGSFSLRLPVGAVPSEVFTQIPKPSRLFLKQGFDTLASIHEKYQEPLASLVLECILSGIPPDASDMTKKFGVDERETRPFVAAISFIMLILSAPSEPEPVPQTVNALVEAEILNRDAQDPVLSLLTRLQIERPKVMGALKRSSLASSLLPALTDLDVMIDVRIEFEKSEVALAVPVVLVHIDTDATHEEIWFQMSASQIDKAVDDLKKIQARLKSAETWIQGRTT